MTIFDIRQPSGIKIEEDTYTKIVDPSSSLFAFDRSKSSPATGMEEEREEDEIQFESSDEPEPESSNYFSDALNFIKGAYEQQYLPLEQRAKEAIKGIPGDFVQTAQALANWLPGQKSKDTFISALGRDLIQRLPTTEDLRAEGAEQFPQFEPQDDKQAFAQEMAVDVSQLGVGAGSILRGLGMAIAGQAGKKSAKALGADEFQQEMAKFGSSFIGGMFGGGRGLKTARNNAYTNMRNAIQPNEQFQYSQNPFVRVMRELNKGSPKENQAQINFVDEIFNKVSNNSMSAEDGERFYRQLNDRIRTASTDDAARLWNRVLEAHTENLGNLSQQNPEFGKWFREGNMLHQGIAESNKVHKFIKKNANFKEFKNAMLFLGLEEAAVPGAGRVTAGSGLVLAAGAYATEVLRRISTNPAMRRYYMNIVNASLNENRHSLMRNLAGLERTLKKESEKDSFEID